LIKDESLGVLATFGGAYFENHLTLHCESDKGCYLACGSRTHAP
jgi:hypothetical protein